jgi:cell division protein ZapE
MNSSEGLDLVSIYMGLTNSSNFHYDENQYATIEKINNSLNKTSFFRKQANIFYIYGSVGSGKSFITNLVFRNFPVKNDSEKLRVTFYNLIDELRSWVNSMIISDNKDQKQNLHSIIKKKIQNLKLLCIDEFHVLDPADAAIISEFIKTLFQRNDISIIINSNRHPDDLYKDGMQKDRFDQTINLIKQKACIINLATLDYRSHFRSFPKNYFIFSDNEKITDQESFKNLFISFACNNYKEKELNILSEKIKYLISIQSNKKIAYFEFNDLFEKNLYATNYQNLIEIIGMKKLFINDIPMLDNNDNNAKRFISFIDIAYENSIKLFLSSNFDFKKIYTKGRLVFEFNRTISRINALCN